MDRFEERQESYLVAQYLNLHNTLVSVALAVAGLAAASIAGSANQYHGNVALMWVFWGASMVAIAVAYAGAAIGAIALPPRLPAISDMVLPLLIGVFEFMLFGSLSSQVVGLLALDSAASVWFLSFSGFCICAGGAVWRAGSIIRSQPEFRKSRAIQVYVRGLRYDIISAWSLGVMSLLVGSANLLSGVPVTVLYAAITVIEVGLIGALASHARTARRMRADLKAEKGDHRRRRGTRKRRPGRPQAAWKVR